MNLAKKLYASTLYSLMGLLNAYKNELAFRLELVIFIVLTPIALYIAQDINQLLWLICSVFLVLIVELGNTAVEATVDRIGTELHELSKYAKDAGSAAVFCAIILAAFVWFAIIAHNYGLWF